MLVSRLVTLHVCVCGEGYLCVCVCVEKDTCVCGGGYLCVDTCVCVCVAAHYAPCVVEEDTCVWILVCVCVAAHYAPWQAF